tara:strand:+ start:936 stop:1127 length:192 start_codon:yes stop_codon:yes gene_type:complete
MVNTAVINSTNAYLLGKGSLQWRHFPLNKKYPNIGILSWNLIGTLQEKQCDEGFMMLIFNGTL